MKRQPEAFRVFRNQDDEFLGFCCILDLQLATDVDLGNDPRARAMWKHTQEHGSAASDERVLAWRFLGAAANVAIAEVVILAAAWRVELAMTRS